MIHSLFESALGNLILTMFEKCTGWAIVIDSDRLYLVPVNDLAEVKIRPLD